MRRTTETNRLDGPVNYKLVQLLVGKRNQRIMKKQAVNKKWEKVKGGNIQMINKKATATAAGQRKKKKKSDRIQD